jgi:ubiquinone/menaquinone biosynthesis C-methylase UbiE
MGKPLLDQSTTSQATGSAHSPVAAPAANSGLQDEYKQRARDQWSADPCGSHVARDLTFGTRSYFDRIEDYRYNVYATWMKGAIGFDSYSGKRLLEVGCGTGTDLLQFARGGSRVVGVDLTPRSIEITRQRFRVYDLDGEFAIGDAENLAFPDNSFDVVYSFGVIHHTPDTRRAVSEFHRVLKPGGRAIVMLYNRASLYYWTSLMLRRGLIGGEFFHSSTAEIMSRHVEYSESEAKPLVKAYTRTEARALFREFNDCRIIIRQLTREEFGRPGRFIPRASVRWLGKHFGWNLLITAVKGR